MTTGKDWLHPGEKAAQARFGSAGFWDPARLEAFFQDRLSAGLARFIENLPFFFIATADARGCCDCAYRGREYNASGQALPLLRITDAKHLVFPDYRGNGLFSSLGNIMRNPYIGMLFIDFDSRRRLRVNGHAEIIADPTAHAETWPLAQRYVQVQIEQVYTNCKARVPRMVLLPPRDSELQDE